MIRKICLLLLISLTITSCAHLNSNFECPMKCGIHCESLDQINARVDRGEMNDTPPLDLKNAAEIEDVETQAPIPPCIDDESKPLRYGETVQRLWLAPFEDKEGNYHNVSEIFVITKPGHWLNAPLKEII